MALDDQKPKTQHSMLIKAIQCWSCLVWNIPNIDQNNQVIYPKRCKGCRLTTYMKTQDDPFF